MYKIGRVTISPIRAVSNHISMKRVGGLINMDVPYSYRFKYSELDQSLTDDSIQLLIEHLSSEGYSPNRWHIGYTSRLRKLLHPIKGSRIVICEAMSHMTIHWSNEMVTLSEYAGSINDIEALILKSWFAGIRCWKWPALSYLVITKHDDSELDAA